MDPDVAVRFEKKVDRSGEHHLWTGARKADGTGMFKVGATPVMARRVAWELVNGAVPEGAQVLSCHVKACVRVDHLRLKVGETPSKPSRSRESTSRVQVQVNGVRVHRRVHGGRGEIETARTQLRQQLRHASPRDVEASRWPLDDLLDRYLEYLEDLGKARRTLARYASVQKNWISPVIGTKQARHVTPDDIDKCFARMRRAGQSGGSMNYAKALLSGAFKWARRTGKVLHSPLVDLELPKSSYVSSEKLPPEADDISSVLAHATALTPDIAPILALAATTGARLGELVAIRIEDVDPERSVVRIASAQDIDGSLKDPKRASHRREVEVDAASLRMLWRHIAEMTERAEKCGLRLARGAYLFSLEPDCASPMRSSYVTKRLQILKGHLGLEDKRPDTVALEDEALRLRREGSVGRSGRHGPPPGGGAALSYDDIAKLLGRSQMWAQRACAAALRRERLGPARRSFNLSFNGLRKFTSSELLEAGFNLSVVAQRQGHGPEILAKHYSKARASARRKAAEHLGRVVHGSSAL